MITLNWVPLPQADVSAYRVYRSMIGFEADVVPPAQVAGMTLILSLNGAMAQAITFNGVESVITQINAQVTGGLAYAAADPQSAYFYFRSNIRKAPGSVQVIGGTALVALNVAPRLITERSENILLATVAALSDPTLTVSYVDQDGVSDDFYGISVVDHLGDESLISTYRQPTTSGGSLCVLQGIVCDMTGRRLADCAVDVHTVGSPQAALAGAQVSVRPLRTLTGPDGRYSIAILQGLLVRVEITDIGFSRTVLVPALQFANVSDLGTDDSDQLQLDSTLGEL